MARSDRVIRRLTLAMKKLESVQQAKESTVRKMSRRPVRPHLLTSQQISLAQPMEASAAAPANSDPAATSAPANQAPQQQAQVLQQQQQQQQQPQQQGKGPDLSLAPPVPIAPPAAAQNIPNNPQAQALMQAFGPNALVNLHTLQTHLRGQGTHPWVAYMEANVTNFKAMPLQVQLQHMTSLQNAVLQRQRSTQGSGSTSAVGSPATMQQPPQMMPNGGMGMVSSPATTRPGSRTRTVRHRRRRARLQAGFQPTCTVRRQVGLVRLQVDKRRTRLDQEARVLWAA